MLTSWGTALRLRAGLVAVALIWIVTTGALFISSPPASAADYPPPAPVATSTCAVDAASASCGTPRITVPRPAQKRDEKLASTGFDAATAMVIVGALVGVGVLCLVAGVRRQRTD